MPLTVSQLAPIKAENPYLYEVLLKLLQELHGMAVQTGVSGAPLPTPPDIASINVTASNGYFSISINDPAGQAQGNLGLHYFIDWSTGPSFLNFTTEDIGPSRSEYISLGDQTLYFRAYSQFRNSGISKKITFGNPPTAVVGGGSAGPPPSGGGSGAGGGGGGFGGGSRTASRLALL